MESKQMTLRSQTVQCPHCGEYYSVTYKYCPFCDAGRKAEERKKAARKQQAGALFSGLFGGKDDEPEEPVRESRRERHPEHRSEHRSAPPAASTPIPRSEGFRKKKTSEMTEEEKRAYRAEREARAAARKRERDRAARAAALTDLTGESRPVPPPLEPVAPAAPAEPAVSVQEKDYPPMETVELTLDPMNAPPADLSEPEPEPAPQPEAAAPAEAPAQPEPAPETPETPAQPAAPAEPQTAWDALQDLRLDEGGDQMDAAPVDVDAVAEPEPAAPQAVPSAVEVEVPTPIPENAPHAVDPAGLIRGDSELDALLSEIRGMLGEGSEVIPAGQPAAAAPAEQPAPPVTAEPAPAAEGPAAEAPAAATPTGEVPVTETPAAESPVEAPSGTEPPAVEVTVGETPAAEVRTEPAAPAPESGLTSEEERLFAEAELLWSPETTAAVEAAAMRKPQPRPQNRQSRPRKKKKKAFPLIPVIAAVVVVALLALLVGKVIAPALQKEEVEEPQTVEILNNAERLFLDKAEVTLTAPGAMETLVPIFIPEGTNAEIKWTCDNWGVVRVDVNGNIEAVSPGTAMVSATLPNGATTGSVITCAWEEGTPPAGSAESAEPAPVVIALSTTDLTMDSQGQTQQLTLNGAESGVTWSSSKPSVATVTADGTVTAVSKGSATVTAEYDGSRYNCEVRCVW